MIFCLKENYIQFFHQLSVLTEECCKSAAIFCGSDICYRISQNSKMDEIGRDIRSHLAQHSCSIRATQSCLCRGQLLNNSTDGDSTGSLNKLCQCSVTLTVNKCFLMLKRESPVFHQIVVVVVFQFQTQPEHTLIWEIILLSQQGNERFPDSALSPAVEEVSCFNVSAIMVTHRAKNIVCCSFYLLHSHGLL